jgi:cysteine desulfurase
MHRGGQRARAALEEARAILRKVVGAGEHDTVVFTSGATEANNMVVQAAAKQGGRLVASQIEHPCVLGPLAQCERHGAKVVLVAPDREGVVSVDAVRAAITPDTALVSIMLANNEVGTINPIAEIVAEVKAIAPQAIVHSDAAQALGKISCSMADLGVDALTVSAHKVGGLAGVGALILRKGLEVPALILGGPQEGKLRGGTENVLGIRVFGEVLKLLAREGDERRQRMARMRDLFEESILRELSDVSVHGLNRVRLPNTSNIYIGGVRADDLVVAMDLEGILISSGSACSSGKPEPSHVLLAMGYDEEHVRATIRVSFRADSEESDIRRLVESLVKAVSRMRAVTQAA